MILCVNVYTENNNFHPLITKYVALLFETKTLKARSHCDGNGEFFQTFPYAVAITMWTLQLVTMIPIIAIVVMNGYWTHSWQWQRHQNNENYAVAVAVWTSLNVIFTGFCCSENEPWPGFQAHLHWASASTLRPPWHSRSIWGCNPFHSDSIGVLGNLSATNWNNIASDIVETSLTISVNRPLWCQHPQKSLYHYSRETPTALTIWVWSWVSGYPGQVRFLPH